MTKKFHLTNPQSNSKTACRGFKSFCPCQTQKSEKRLEQAIFRTFLFDISSKKSHGARSDNTILTLKKSSKCSSGGNKSNASVGHIIKISAVFGWLITKLFADFKKILRNTSVWCCGVLRYLCLASHILTQHL